MMPNLARSDNDDRTNSVLSTSSHTHVDNNDALASSPHSKMTAWPVKHAEPVAEPKAHPPSTAPASQSVADPLPVPSTAQVGRRSIGRQQRADRPPPPKCMLSCIESIESCTQNVVRFNERMELNRAQAEAQRAEKRDSPIASKAIIPLAFVILSWVFLAYVWRLCSRLIQQNPQGEVLGSRSEGVGLLVGFVILWLMTMWSYVVVISKGPGLVKDYVAESDPPSAAAQGQWWSPASAAPQPQQYQEGAAQPMPIPGRMHQSSDIAAMQASSSVDGHAIASASSTLSFPYPSFNADLQRFGGDRASSDSMRVLPGSVEPKHTVDSADFTHSYDEYRRTIAEEDAVAAADTLAADVEAQLDAEMRSTMPSAEASDVATNAQLPDVVGPLAAAAIAGGQGVRQGAEMLNDSACGAPRTDDTNAAASGWSVPRRTLPNDPPPLSASSQYCHRCRRVKPPRAHHCRRCGTCVLKMDHHCPWVGGCVGAHNQRFFFIFVLWVTLLELYTLVTTAVCFHRGVQSLQVGSAWRLDGFLISLLPICAVFLMFTGALLGTHVWLMGRNMTTVEHVAVSRMQARERVLVDRWVGMQKQAGLAGFKMKRQLVREWDAEWGALTTEANRWWLGGSNEVDFTQHSNDATGQGAQEKPCATSSRNRKQQGAFQTNIQQSLGASLLFWILPLGDHPNDGLVFPMNPRFGQFGVWRKRQDWPVALQ